jgi:hypothetical protein
MRNTGLLPSRASQGLLDKKYGAPDIDREQGVEILNCHFLNEANFETPALAADTA